VFSLFMLPRNQQTSQSQSIQKTSREMRLAKSHPEPQGWRVTERYQPSGDLKK
jgi:hypothetical protein